MEIWMAVLACFLIGELLYASPKARTVVSNTATTVAANAIRWGPIYLALILI
jgi:hypothetical protein